MSAFVEDFKTKWRQKTQEMDNELFRTIVGADVFPQGRAAFALVFDEQSKEANEPPALFITQWGENTSKIKEAVYPIAGLYYWAVRELPQRLTRNPVSRY